MHGDARRFFELGWATASTLVAICWASAETSQSRDFAPQPRRGQRYIFVTVKPDSLALSTVLFFHSEILMVPGMKSLLSLVSSSAIFFSSGIVSLSK